MNDEELKARQLTYITPGDGYADIKLSRSYDMGGTKTSTLRMREPTLQDQLVMEALKGGVAAQEIGFLANLCEQSPDDIKTFTMRDYKRLQAAVSVFSD